MIKNLQQKFFINILSTQRFGDLLHSQGLIPIFKVSITFCIKKKVVTI